MSKKVIRSESCLAGNHNFIVSYWLFDAKSQKANAYTCQKCLLTKSGLSDIEQLKDEIHKEP